MKFILEPSNLIFAAAAVASGSMLLWPLIAKRGSSGGISSLELTQLINTRHAIVLDVREPDEFALGSVTGARNMPLSTLAARAGEIARFKAKPIVVVCQAGTRAKQAVTVLGAAGFGEVYLLSGGISAWREAGLPLVKSVREQGAGAKKG